MNLAVGVNGTGVMGAEHALLLSGVTGGAYLAAVCDADAGRATAAVQAVAIDSPRALALKECSK